MRVNFNSSKRVGMYGTTGGFLLVVKKSISTECKFIPECGIKLFFKSVDLRWRVENETKLPNIILELKRNRRPPALILVI